MCGYTLESTTRRPRTSILAPLGLVYAFTDVDFDVAPHARPVCNDHTFSPLDRAKEARLMMAHVS
jgi:hypothetical protein